MYFSTHEIRRRGKRYDKHGWAREQIEIPAKFQDKEKLKIINPGFIIKTSFEFSSGHDRLCNFLVCVYETKSCYVPKAGFKLSASQMLE